MSSRNDRFIAGNPPAAFTAVPNGVFGGFVHSQGVLKVEMYRNTHGGARLNVRRDQGALFSLRGEPQAEGFILFQLFRRFPGHVRRGSSCKQLASERVQNLCQTQQ